MGENNISVRHIQKKFGDNHVLNDVSLEMCAGRIYGLVGYNGSGKTVFLKCVCGILKVDAGEILANGVKVGSEMLQSAGIIIEEPAFLRNESGRKNLELLYMLNHKRDVAAVSRAMEGVGLDPKLKKPVRNYSLGMRQRLAIAQAVMEDPDFLILDEPMNGLDRDGLREIRTMLLDLKDAGKLILLASHNREDIEILCDEAYEMEHGQLTRFA